MTSNKLWLPLALAATALLFGCPTTKSEEPDAGALCGNGQLDPGEDCDDGNQLPNDGCEPNCTKSVPRCGDGHVDPANNEECDDGNQVPGDGCEPDCKRTKAGPNVTVCPGTLPTPAAGASCAVVPASDANNKKLLLAGDVLTPGQVLRGGQVLLDANGKIACVACDCAAEAAGAQQIACPDAVISPGLINTHDHITFANNQPMPSAERYEHRHEWRKGYNGHTRITVPGGATSDTISWAELRFVFGGATSTVSSGSAPGLLRNLDKTDQEGLNQPLVDFDTFPLGDNSFQPIDSTCAYPKITDPSTADAYLPHIGEGISKAAHNELLCTETTANGGKDIINGNTATIHGIGVTPADVAQMQGPDGKKAALIWSPRSNISLYGNTAPVVMYAHMGIPVALGTDWIASGSMNMLRELQCAADLNATYFGGFFTDEQLWMMATATAAKVTATDDAIGSLTVGLFGDVAIFKKNGKVDHRAVIDAAPKDVLLVLRGGAVLYGDADVVGALPASADCDPVTVCQVSKKACVFRETGKHYAALEGAEQSKYKLDFCQDPILKEPSCQPTRPAAVNYSTIYTGAPTATDQDGDGYEDAEDNCPTVFNPVRPMDVDLTKWDPASGTKPPQPDADGDGIGDACDPCPLDPGGAGNCKTIDVNDLDGDGVPNASDNCPNKPNPDQADADHDGVGDACDKCPNDPGTCPATVYDIKDPVNKKYAAGDVVKLSNLLVTGVGSNGFFAQHKDGDTAFAGADYSGIFVFTKTAPTVAVGDRVDISSTTIALYAGAFELTNSTVAVTSSGEAAPAPVLVAPAEIATSGNKAAALEGVLVKVESVTVTSANPDAPQSFNEFEVTGSLRVDDYLYLMTPLPALGDSFTSITGVLALRSGNTKVEPRSVNDLLQAAAIASFGPAHSYTREGKTATLTFPAALTVTLAKAMSTPTDVTITSSASGVAVVTGGKVTVPANATSVEVPVDALAASPTEVTFSAAVAGGSPLTANVRVLGANEAPAALTLAPKTVTLAAGAKQTFTVTSDIPAPPNGTVVTLSAQPTGVTMPATATIPADATSATFEATAGGVEQAVTITASAGTASDTATVTVQGGLGVFASLTPATGFARVGSTNIVPSALTATLAAPVLVDTVCTVVSSDVAALSVVSPLTVAAGGTSAAVGFTANAAAASVTVTVTCNGTAKTATLRVLGTAEAPATLTLTAAAATTPVGGTVAVTAALDIPAPAGGIDVALAVSPAGAGTAPATVHINADALSATFDFVAGVVEQAARVTGTAGSLSGFADITIAGGAGELVGFGPATGAYARVGATGATFPVALQVQLRQAVLVPTTIVVDSGSTDLTVVGGAVTVPAGQTSASVIVTGNVANATGVTLTARQGAAVSFTAGVKVLGASQLPTSVTLSPATATIKAGEAVSLTATIDVPAPAGFVLDVAISPAGGGTAIASVPFAADTTSATFNFTAGAGQQPVTVTVSSTAAAITSSSVITVSGGLGVLADLLPATAFARVGDTGPTFPGALTVSLASAVLVPTDVTVTSSDIAALTIVNGTITIPAGQTSGVVHVTGVAASPSVTVTATVGGVPKTASVKVLAAGVLPTAVATLVPAAATVKPNGIVSVTATLDIPAGASGAVIDLTTSAGTVPASVNVAANQQSATFDFTAGSTTGLVTLTANLQGGTAAAATAQVDVQATVCTPSQIVISQVYGGGGNTGAPYKNDFIELHNRGATPVDLSGWSVQYASSTGSTWTATPLTGKTIDPGKYLLIQEAAGTGTAPALPTPDVTAAIAMSGSTGKVALVSVATALTGTCPTTNVVDFVGYGSANCSEGSVPTGGLSATTAALRNGDGCTDTTNNAADFTVAAPAPRNSASPAVACGCQ